MRSALARLLTLGLLGAGLGFATASPAAAEYVAPTRVVFEVDDNVGEYGDRMFLSGRVEWQAPDGTWQMPFDGEVTLERRTAKSGDFEAVATDTSPGSLSFLDYDEYLVNADFQARFTGGSYNHSAYGEVTYAPSVSVVIQTFTTRKATLSSDRKANGDVFAVGTVEPKGVHAMLVEYKKGKKWVKVLTTKTRKNGAYSFRVRNFSSGKGTLHRVTFKNTPTLTKSGFTFRAIRY